MGDRAMRYYDNNGYEVYKCLQCQQHFDSMMGNYCNECIDRMKHRNTMVRLKQREVVALETIAKLQERVKELEKSDDKCELCGASPMTANCNNAGCDK